MTDKKREIDHQRELRKQKRDIFEMIDDMLELHTHNSIPCYTGEEDEGCTTCIRNKVLEDVITKLKGEV